MFAHGLDDFGLNSPEAFLRFLERVCQNKTNQLFRHDVAAQKWSLSHEVPIGRHEREVFSRIDAAKGPTEQESAEDEERNVLDKLSLRDRPIVLGLRMGCSLELLSFLFSVSVKTIRRIGEPSRKPIAEDSGITSSTRAGAHEAQQNESNVQVCSTTEDC